MSSKQRRVLSMSRVLSVDKVSGTQIFSWVKGAFHVKSSKYGEVYQKYKTLPNYLMND